MLTTDPREIQAGDQVTWITEEDGEQVSLPIVTKVTHHEGRYGEYVRVWINEEFYSVHHVDGAIEILYEIERG